MVQPPPFDDRLHAGRCLAGALAKFRGTRPLVLAIPRGAVSMAGVVARALGGDLDVVLVRKLCAPGNPELAIGAVDEGGEVEVDEFAADWAGADAGYLRREVERQSALIRGRRRRYAPGRAASEIAGRTVIVVDDGLATGATMGAALHAVRARRPGWLVCAVPVGARRALARVAARADEVVCLSTPDPFVAVGAHYRDFREVDDAEVAAALAASRGGGDPVIAAYRVHVRLDGVSLAAAFSAPARPRLLVVVADGAGNGGHGLRDARVEDALRRDGDATLVVDLLAPEERQRGDVRFDIPLLARRLEAAIDPARRDPRHRPLPLVLYGIGNGAAAALSLAARRPGDVRAVVARGGRPDLAGAPALARVRVPVLLVVGGADVDALAPNRAAADAIGARAELAVIPGGTCWFEEPEALERLGDACTEWLARVLPRARSLSA